jgi:hypothetical protein
LTRIDREKNLDMSWAPALSERRHRSLARRLILCVGGAPSLEMKVTEVRDLENHKCDNGDNQECRQRN